MIFIYVFTLIFALFCTFLWFYILFLSKMDKNCENISELDNLFFNKSIKFNYRNFNSSYTYYKLKKLTKNKFKHIAQEKIFYSNYDYLSSLAKFIDYKINNPKNKYRCKNNHVLIDEIAYITAKNILLSNNCNLFALFVKHSKRFSLKQKEYKIFKILLAQKLLDIIIKIESELQAISSVIQKSKSYKKIKNYSKEILKSAHIYSLLFYNNNSNKILYGFNLNTNNVIKNLFFELYEAEYKLKLSITYLKTMFT